MITRGRNLRKIEWKNILSSIVQMLWYIQSNLKIMAEQIVENLTVVKSLNHKINALIKTFWRIFTRAGLL